MRGIVIFRRLWRRGSVLALALALVFALLRRRRLCDAIIVLWGRRHRGQQGPDLHHTKHTVMHAFFKLRPS